MLPRLFAHRPDRAEKGIRLGCGLVLGAFAATLVVLTEVADPQPLHWVVAAFATVAAGVLAVRYGDRFWAAIASLVRRSGGP